MDNRYRWATEEIYSSDEAWNKEFDLLKTQLDFSVFRGKLGEKSQFLACMKEQERVGRIFEKLSVYAMMKHDEDTKNALYDSFNAKIMSLGAVFGSNTAFIMPELTSLSEKVLEEYILDKDLSEYDYFLKNVLKEKNRFLYK